MLTRKTELKIRKAHRYLGVFLGLQFLMWTISGMYFSWTNIDEIHGDHFKKELTEREAIKVAERYMLASLEFEQIQRIETVGAHHEYRGKPLPAYEISYKTDENLKAYVAIENGAFQTVRHREWRWFDFLWMTHTMDYQGRDNFNTIVLRAFSFLGLITVLSGFLLWFISSATIRKLKK
ncbi:MAG: PepSY domain-containing protein [Flavobacteriaceae bacterium]